MGFKFNGIHSDTFKICVRTESLPCIAPKRQTTISVPGRDGQHVVEDGYDNIEVKFECSIVDEFPVGRRKNTRAIASWLADTGVLILDHEKDVEYRVVRSVTNIDITPRGYEVPVDDFKITFECLPHPRSAYYNDGLYWDTCTSSWQYLEMPWPGYIRTFEVSNGDNIDVHNAGTYKALPVIKMEGVASSVTVGDFTITGLSGIVYIDCFNQLVYSMSGASKVNQISKFSGKFPELKPGENIFPISGSITNLVIEFDYKNTYR